MQTIGIEWKIIHPRGSALEAGDMKVDLSRQLRILTLSNRSPRSKGGAPSLYFPRSAIAIHSLSTNSHQDDLLSQ